MQTLQELISRHGQNGKVEWIGLRPSRRADVKVVQRVMADEADGLVGDRYAGRSGKRHLTLIQAEHLPVVASMVGREHVDPAELRRNIVVSGLNLLALKDKRFRVGGAVVEYTGLCHPCSRMEEILGPGGYNALRGHGGITAMVIESGEIAIGDAVSLIGQAGN